MRFSYGAAPCRLLCTSSGNVTKFAYASKLANVLFLCLMSLRVSVLLLLLIFPLQHANHISPGAKHC